MSRLDDAMVAVRTNPKDSNAWSNLGELLVADGQIEKAKQSFQRALQLDPTNQAAQRGLSGAFVAETPVAPPTPTRPTPPPPERFSPPPSRPAESRTAPPPSTPRSAAPEIREESRTIPKGIDTAPRPALTPQRPAASGSAAAGERSLFRKPPPPPQKPSQTRMMMGLAVIGVVMALCLVACLALLIQF